MYNVLAQWELREGNNPQMLRYPEVDEVLVPTVCSWGLIIGLLPFSFQDPGPSQPSNLSTLNEADLYSTMREGATWGDSRGSDFSGAKGGAGVKEQRRGCNR